MRLYVALLSLVVCASCTRSATIGDEYVGKLYMNNPLGEGIAPDGDPLIRFDAFDCTTFVETALADGDADKLNQIRYKDGVIDFVNRNHFMETDWLPNNSNILYDVTEQYGKTAVRTVNINRANWMKYKYGIYDNTPVQIAHLKYIPYNQIDHIKPTEPLVVLFVSGTPKNMSVIGTDLAVTHMGFLLPNGILRHASKKDKCVTDTEFDKYINRMVENKNNLGIMLMEIKKL